MGSEKRKFWEYKKPGAASITFKFRSQSQGSNRRKPKPSPSDALSLNLYPSVTKDAKEQVLDSSGLEGEIIDKVEPDSKCEELNEADRCLELRNYIDLVSTSCKVRIKASLNEAKSSNQHDDKRLKLDPILLDDIDTLNDLDVNTVVEAKNTGVTIHPVGTRSMSIKEEMVEQEKPNVKNSTSKSHVKAQRKKMKFQTKKLRRENSELVKELRRLGEQCEIVGDENTALLDELEQAFGREAVSDLREIHSSLKSNQSNVDGEGGSRSDNSTKDDHK